jgi:hypothetical protein
MGYAPKALKVFFCAAFRLACETAGTGVPTQGHAEVQEYSSGKLNSVSDFPQ